MSESLIGGPANVIAQRDQRVELLLIDCADLRAERDKAWRELLLERATRRDLEDMIDLADSLKGNAERLLAVVVAEQVTP